MSRVLETLEAQKMELEIETGRWLREVRRAHGIRGCEVRIQVLESGLYTHWSGDASYDTDHRGFWGSASVCASDDDRTVQETARDMVEQVLDACAQSEA